MAVQANVAKQKDIERLFAETKKAYGKLDILVNNAGVYEFLPLENVSDEHFHRLYDLNVLGLLLTSKEAAKHFATDGGSIVNISSVAAIISPPSASVYASTKAAVDSITRSLAKEFGPRKIRVNSINPGLVITEGVESVNQKLSQRGLAVRAGDGDEFSPPEEEGEIQFAQAAEASGARCGEPAMFQGKPWTKDDEIVQRRFGRAEVFPGVLHLFVIEHTPGTE